MEIVKFTIPFSASARDQNVIENQRRLIEAYGVRTPP